MRNLGLTHAFKDLAGNFPNPNEIGRKIEVKKHLEADKKLITEVNAEIAEKKLKEAIELRFGNSLANKFPTEQPIELMPIPENWKGEFLEDSLKHNYPGTLGSVFWPESKYVILDLEAELGHPIPRSKITFTANSTYHTSTGNHTASSGKLTIACDDQIFQTNGAKDCTDFNTGVYLAWNLRDNKGRWAGTGVYIQIYNFQWEIKGADPKVNGVINRYPGSGSKIENYGIKRVSPKKWKLTF